MKTCRKKRIRPVWHKVVSDQHRKALEEDAYWIIFSDVRKNPHLYLPDPASVKPRKTKKLIHALAKIGSPSMPDETIVRMLAKRCAFWLYAPGLLLDRAEEQLGEIEATMFSPNRITQPTDESVVLKELAALRDLMRSKEPGLDAWRIYVASLILLDTLRLSQTKGTCTEFAKTILGLMEKSYGNLMWGFEELKDSKAVKRRFVITLITLLDAKWRGKQPRPREVDIQRAAYRVGRLFKTEEPLKDPNRTGIPDDESLHRRYGKMLRREKLGLGKKAPAVQRSF